MDQINNTNEVEEVNLLDVINPPERTEGTAYDEDFDTPNDAEPDFDAEETDEDDSDEVIEDDEDPYENEEKN